MQENIIVDIHIKFLCFFGIALSVFCFSNANVYGEDRVPCGPGCFCIYDGKGTSGNFNWCNFKAQPVSCDGVEKGFYFKYGMYDNTGLLACHREILSAVYYFDEFSELYKDGEPGGMYGFIGDDLMVMPQGMYGDRGIYSCPSSYPDSDSGAKTVFDCYKYDASGKKVYFKRSLKRGMLDIKKEIIHAGISVKQTEKNNGSEIQQTKIGKTNVGTLNNDLETAKKMISVGISK